MLAASQPSHSGGVERPRAAASGASTHAPEVMTARSRLIKSELEEQDLVVLPQQADREHIRRWLPTLTPREGGRTRTQNLCRGEVDARRSATVDRRRRGVQAGVLDPVRVGSVEHEDDLPEPLRRVVPKAEHAGRAGSRRGAGHRVLVAPFAPSRGSPRQDDPDPSPRSRSFPAPAAARPAALLVGRERLAEPRLAAAPS